MGSEVISVRTATAADISPVDTLLAQSYARLLKGSYPPSVMVTAVPLISRANPFLISSGTYYVACDEAGAILGAGGWSRSSRGRKVADVRHLVTHHQHLRKGVARQIMESVIAEARRAGITQMESLSTRVAVPFYAAMGFDTRMEVDVELRPGIVFPAVRMLKSL